MPEAPRPRSTIPTLAELAVAGKLDLAPLVTHRFRLEEIHEAIEATRSGTAGRVVLALS